MEFINRLEKLILDNISGTPKITPSGWVSFNAPCCPHVNPIHKKDRLKRGGIRYTNNGGLVYNCFNCGFATAWDPSKNLSRKMKTFLSWCGASEDEIVKLSHDIWVELKNSDNILQLPKERVFRYQPLDFEEIDLPNNTTPILNSSANKDVEDKLVYLHSRGEYMFRNLKFFWSTTDKKDHMNRRIIIPFYWNGNIVGYTGRSIDKDKQRYFSYIPKDYIFNTEVIKKEHKYIIVTEGPFDALSCNGVALLGDKCSENQATWLNRTGKEIIIVPDKTAMDGKLVKMAHKYGWHIAKPDWDSNIKDCADSTKKYGVIYTVKSIMDSITK